MLTGILTVDPPADRPAVPLTLFLPMLRPRLPSAVLRHALRAACRLVAVAALAATASGALAQPDSPARPAPDGALRVAVTDSPPFAEQSPDGVWTGLGVELATSVAQTLGRPVQVVGVPAGAGGDGALAALGGRADLALVVATPEAEAAADLTATFYSARLGVARQGGARLAEIAGRFFSPTFFKIALGLSLLLFLIGLAMWALERKEEGDDFAEDTSGIWDGFWWSGVTMTTIGYGDTVPTSVGGRSLALVWMLVSMAVTAALTAALVSALGLKGGGNATLPDDLKGDRVGVVEGSVAERVLAESRVDARTYPTLSAGLDAVEADSLDAFVDSVPQLRAETGSSSDLTIQTTGVEVEQWAFAVAPGDALREPVTQAVLDRIQSPDWRDAVRRYVPSD